MQIYRIPTLLLGKAMKYSKLQAQLQDIDSNSVLALFHASFKLAVYLFRELAVACITA